MVIDPFNNKNTSNEEVDLNKIQKYLVENYLDLLASEESLVLKDKIRNYLYDNYNITNDCEIENLTSKVLDKIFGYGILQKYLDNVDVTDIRVIKYDKIYVKDKGSWKCTNDKFINEEEFIEYIRYIVLKNGKIINFEKPLIVFSDRRNNLRIEAGISPVNVNSASLVIRIHRNEKIKTLEVLRDDYNMLEQKEYEILNKAILQNSNIVISGKGGSGKTTLLRAIIEKLPDNMAISTNEETAELSIQNKNVIQREVLQTREGGQNINLETLTKHSLVSSNDAIIVGELKGSEASIFFDAVSTGHLGFATVHSDSAENTIDRLVTLVKRDIASQQYKEEFIQKLLSKSIDYIVYMKNFKINEIIKVGFVRNRIKYEYLFKREVI